MFYYPTALKRHTGCFTTIWLAATKGIKVSRRDYLKVNVPRTCDDIMDYVLVRVPPPRPGLPRPRFSLYLSSQLQYGVVVVFHHQCGILLDELRTILERLTKSKSTGKINLVDKDGPPLCVPDALLLLNQTEGAPDPLFGVMTCGDPLPSPRTLMEMRDMLPDTRPQERMPAPRRAPPQSSLTVSPESITLREPAVSIPTTEFEGLELPDHDPDMIDFLLGQEEHFPEEGPELAGETGRGRAVDREPAAIAPPEGGRGRERPQVVAGREPGRPEVVPARERERGRPDMVPKRERPEEVLERESKRPEEVPERERPEEVLERESKRPEEVPGRGRERPEEVPGRGRERPEEVRGRERERPEEVPGRELDRADVAERERERFEETTASTGPLQPTLTSGEGATLLRQEEPAPSEEAPWPLTRDVTPVSLPRIPSLPRPERASPTLEEMLLSSEEEEPLRRRVARRRKQLLFFDPDTQLSPEELRQRIGDHQTQTRRPLLPPPPSHRMLPAAQLLAEPCNFLPEAIRSLWEQAATVTPLPGTDLRAGQRGSETPDSDGDGEARREQDPAELQSVEALRRTLQSPHSLSNISGQSLHSLETSDKALLRETSPQITPEGAGVVMLRDERSPVSRSPSRLEDIPEEADVELAGPSLPVDQRGPEYPDPEEYPLLFHTLMPPLAHSRTVSACFWRLLEKVASRKLCVEQDEPYSDIRIYPGPNYEEGLSDESLYA